MRLTIPTLALTFAVVWAPAFAQDAATPDAPPAAESAPSVPTGEVPATAESPAASLDDVAAAVAALPVAVGDVQVVGPWVDGEQRGVWRTVMTQDAGETAGNRFFLQRIAETDGGMGVAETLEVTEIAEIEGAVVGYRTDAPPEGQESTLTLFFDIVPLDGEISETYELFVTPGQPYRFGPATN